MGWLHAPYKINKDDESKSRYKRIVDRDTESPELKMPEIDSHEYILELFYQSGMILNGAHGAVPITWTELRNYSEQSGVDLTPWESEIVMRLSRAYCSAYHDGQKPEALPPWMPEDTDSITKQRENVSNTLAAMGQAMKESKPKPRKKPKPA